MGIFIFLTVLFYPSSHYRASVGIIFLCNKEKTYPKGRKGWTDIACNEQICNFVFNGFLSWWKIEQTAGGKRSSMVKSFGGDGGKDSAFSLLNAFLKLWYWQGTFKRSWGLGGAGPQLGARVEFKQMEWQWGLHLIALPLFIQSMCYECETMDNPEVGVVSWDNK